jgi:hypothetical protein
MATAVIVILQANNEQRVFQKARAVIAGNRLRIYRDKEPQELTESTMVAEFDLQEVKSWFPVADTHR